MTAALRVAIVDDERHARAAIRVLLERRGRIDVVAECASGAEAVEVLQWVDVDLLLLDVQMPGLDGFGVLHARGEKAPPTVFVTAFDAYALKAFEVGALDYVLKPFDDARFFAAFDRACARIDERRRAHWAKRLLAATADRAATPPSAPPSRLPIPAGHRVVFVPFDEIDWIQAADQYVVVHVGAKEHLLRESLQRLAARLPRPPFAHVHRSHIVNVSKIREVARLRNGDALLTLADGRCLRVSRRYRRALADAIGQRM